MVRRASISVLAFGEVFVGFADTPAEQKMHIVMNSGPGGVGDRRHGRQIQNQKRADFFQFVINCYEVRGHVASFYMGGG